MTKIESDRCKQIRCEEQRNDRSVTNKTAGGRAAGPHKPRETQWDVARSRRSKAREMVLPARVRQPDRHSPRARLPLSPCESEKRFGGQWESCASSFTLHSASIGVHRETVCTAAAEAPKVQRLPSHDIPHTDSLSRSRLLLYLYPHSTPPWLSSSAAVVQRLLVKSPIPSSTSAPIAFP